MINAKFVGNKKINVEANGFNIPVDLGKKEGGDASAPNPFMLLMAALLACSSYHVLLLAERLGMNKEAFRVELEPGLDSNGDMQKALIKVFVPSDFPKEREAALKASVMACKAGKHLKAERTVEIIRA